MTPIDTLLSEKQLATRINVARPTLRKWRHEKRGPAYTRLGGAIRYSESAVQAWLLANTVAPKAA